MDRKAQAQQLYMQGATHKEIAAAVGVTDRTIFTWIHQYSWDKLRLSAYQAPMTIADNLCSQIVELQNTIAARPAGSRYPTMQEAEIMRKLITMLEKMKKTPSLSQNMQMLETFRNYVRPLDKEFSKKLGSYAERFLEGKSVNGYAPYQPEYGVEPVPAIMPFYPEAEEKEDLGESVPQPCPSINDCLHEGDCSYPHCKHPQLYAKPLEPGERYRIPSIHYQQMAQAVPATDISVTGPAAASADNRKENGSVEATKPAAQPQQPHLPPVAVTPLNMAESDRKENRNHDDSPLTARPNVDRMLAQIQEKLRRQQGNKDATDPINAAA